VTHNTSHDLKTREHQEHQHDDQSEHDHGDSKDHVHAHGATDKEHAGHDHDHGGIFGEKSELIFALLAGAFMLAGWLCTWTQSGPDWLSTTLFCIAYLFGGYFTTKEALENILARRFEIDTLMLVAAAGAGALGKWGEGALLLFLFSLGHSLEHFAMGRARRAIEALAKLAPETASVKRGDKVEEVAVETLKPGDIVLVKPNERLPADGVVVKGTTSVNQAPVTGESVPVDKQPVADGAAVIAAFEKVAANNRVLPAPSMDRAGSR
jgi:Cd2+/Zn2+-exporting ATPase